VLSSRTEVEPLFTASLDHHYLAVL